MIWYALKQHQISLRLLKTAGLYSEPYQKRTVYIRRRGCTRSQLLSDSRQVSHGGSLEPNATGDPFVIQTASILKTSQHTSVNWFVSSRVVTWTRGLDGWLECLEECLVCLMMKWLADEVWKNPCVLFGSEWRIFSAFFVLFSFFFSWNTLVVL